MDALWEISSAIVGEEYPFNPIEAFVLGGAFLVHDLGMSLSAYPNGLSDIAADAAWQDTVASLLWEQSGRKPTLEETEHPPQEVARMAIAQVLRLRHAHFAASLCVSPWTYRGETFHLLEDSGLRDSFGEVIGSLGESHNWDIEDVEARMRRTIGSPPGFPQSWTVDVLKLACVLRAADASQLDSRRAPAFVMAIRQPRDESLPYWQFQRRMLQPHVQDDRLAYSSSSFPRSEAQAWWLCYETLKMVDKELRECDELLSTANRMRFQVRGVFNVDHPDRITGQIPTNGWRPVDASIRVSNTERLVKLFGGEQLYGTDSFVVPLRELVQNACDAVRARRHIEHRTSDWGSVHVKVEEESNISRLIVSDTGTGMSQAVMTGALVDFGQSYWMSPLVRTEMPGLTSSAFRAAGRYGIGFFSTFMVGQRVKVVSRRYSASPTETGVLEFTHGASSRPLYRPADSHERLIEPGTVVTIELETHPMADGGLLSAVSNGRQTQNLSETLKWAVASLAPSADVTIFTQHDNSEKLAAVTANDWLTLPPNELCSRVENTTVVSLLTDVRAPDGQLLGRLATSPRRLAVVTSEGIKTGLVGNIQGLIQGEPARAVRDSSRLELPPEAINEWSRKQVGLISRKVRKAQQHEYAALHASLGQNVDTLAFTWTRDGWVNAKDFRSWLKTKTEVILADFINLSGWWSSADGGDDRYISTDSLHGIEFPDGMVVAFAHRTPRTISNYQVLAGGVVESEFPDFFASGQREMSFARRVQELILKTWGRHTKSYEEDLEFDWDPGWVDATCQIFSR